MPWLTNGLILLYGLFNLLNAREVQSDTQDFYSDAGRTVSFRCTLPHDGGGGAVAWRYYSDDEDRRAEIIATNDNVMSGSRYYGRSSVVITSRTYNLTITDLHRNDTGVYKCSAMSDKLEEYRLYVFTDGYPRCTDDGVPQNQGDHTADHSVILTCESGVENNYPEIRWFRGGNSSELASSNNQGNTLRTQVTISEKDENVRFTCVVGIGEDTSRSCYVTPLPRKPTANISPSIARGNVGEVVIFTCTGSAKDGDISIKWDDNTLRQYHGRYETSDTQLRIRNLTATDHETNIVCIVRDTTVGTEENATAILLINEYPNTNATAETTTVPNKRNNLNTSGNGPGFIAGLLVAVVLALILATFLIFLFVKRSKSRIKRYPSYPEHGEKVNEYDDVSEKGGARLNPDGVEYTAVGSVTYQRKEDQENEIGSHYSVERNGGIVTRPAKDYSHNYEQMDLSKQIPEYKAGDDQADDETTPVYAEVNKRGSKFERSNPQEGGSRASSGKPYGYSRIEEDKFKQTENGAEDKMVSDDTEYAQVNKKKGESRNQIYEDGYAKPDLQHNDPPHSDIADWSNSPSAEKSKKQPGAPRHAAVVRDKSASQIEMLEEVYSEPNVDQQHDNEDRNGILPQSVKEVVGKKDSLDGYAKPMFDGADDNLQDSANGDALANVTEAEYAEADVTNEGSNIPGYSKADFNLPVDQVESLSESTDPASPLYAEVQKREDSHNAQGEILDSKKKEKPKYAKVKKGPQK